MNNIPEVPDVIPQGMTGCTNTKDQSIRKAGIRGIGSEDHTRHRDMTREKLWCFGLHEGIGRKDNK
jgi:hypothetical protein